MPVTLEPSRATVEPEQTTAKPTTTPLTDRVTTLAVEPNLERNKFFTDIRKVNIRDADSNEVSDDAVTQYIRFLHNYVSRAVKEDVLRAFHDPDKIGRKKKTPKGGAIAKRAAKYLYSEHGIKILGSAKSDLDNKLSQSYIQRDEVYLRFSNEFSWNNGDYGDPDSCFWGSYTYCRLILAAANEALVCQTFTRREPPIGGWEAPVTEPVQEQEEYILDKEGNPKLNKKGKPKTHLVRYEPLGRCFLYDHSEYKTDNPESWNDVELFLFNAYGKLQINHMASIFAMMYNSKQRTTPYGFTPDSSKIYTNGDKLYNIYNHDRKLLEKYYTNYTGDDEAPNFACSCCGKRQPELDKDRYLFVGSGNAPPRISCKNCASKHGRECKRCGRQQPNLPRPL